MNPPMNSVTLPAGEALPSLGLGTWHMGESASTRADEITAIRLAVEIGYRVFDTAEMYGEGGAEEVLGQALAEAMRAGDATREELFVVSKVYPHNASRVGAVAACERSLKRLKLDHIDLYLLHWPGPHPLGETVAGFAALQSASAIRHWGVSNFDTDDMVELSGVKGAEACAVNQVYYSLSERGPEFDLLPWQHARGIPLMAYCPIDQGQLAHDAALRRIGEQHGVTASQVALAWAASQPGVVAIPKAVREAHLRENIAAASLSLSADAWAELDRVFPPPRRKRPLAMR